MRVDARSISIRSENEFPTELSRIASFFPDRHPDFKGPTDDHGECAYGFVFHVACAAALMGRVHMGGDVAGDRTFFGHVQAERAIELLCGVRVDRVGEVKDV